MLIFERIIAQNIKDKLFQGKVILIFGARQVGKTTLCKELLREFPEKSLYVNCELLQNKIALETANDHQLKDFLGGNRLVVLDEAQKIKDIGTTLKIMADTHPEIQIIATGSSSFELANKTSEAMTGRARRFMLYPLSIEEIARNFSKSDIDAKLENILRFGSYPGVFDKPEKEAIEELTEIASNYLYKDIFEFSGIRHPDLVSNLLSAIALQLGSEASISELANPLKTSSYTIDSYLALLEQAFIIFRLRPLSRNPRKEIGKKYKIFFYDLGIRNSLIRNFNPLALRNDVGALWENFCILERMKRNSNRRLNPNYYFWRTYDQKEIDLVEEREGNLFGYEFKWSGKGAKEPKIWRESYANAEYLIINRENFLDFIL